MLKKQEILEYHSISCFLNKKYILVFKFILYQIAVH